MCLLIIDMDGNTTRHRPKEVILSQTPQTHSPGHNEENKIMVRFGNTPLQSIIGVAMYAAVLTTIGVSLAATFMA